VAKVDVRAAMATPAQTGRMRVVLASAVGSALEWYDFFIYGTAAALVFNELFFPKLDPWSGTLAAFAAFGVGFFARPFGGLVFGHFGDRLGRKPMLVTTLLMVGIATFLIGLIPTYARIGAWAPGLLVFLRLVQGFAAGAEYGGAVIFAVEYAPEGRRGLFGSWAPIGVTLGNLMAAGVFALVTLLPKEQLLAWGWRVPFLLSALLVAFGLYIRLRVAETPVFAEVAQQRTALKAPVLDAIRRHPRSFLVVIGSRLAENGLGYLFPVFGLNYIIQQLQMPKSTALFGVILSQFLSLLTIPLFSALSDRIGRRPVYLGAALWSAAWAFPFFLLCETKDPLLIWVAFVGATTIGVSGMFGPQAAYYSELFGPRVRFGGFAFARELGSLLAGGPAPFLAAYLLTQAGGRPWGVAWYIVALALLTAVSIAIGPETHKSDIAAEHAGDRPGAS
jgi:MFS transporter, MHS family, shikimate and dehydroshikimate transport protein